VIILVGVVIWAVMRRTEGSSGGSGTRAPDTPLDILKRRYAQGEISRDEFENMKKDLER
jgi:putative membrane protein